VPVRPPWSLLVVVLAGLAVLALVVTRSPGGAGAPMAWAGATTTNGVPEVRPVPLLGEPQQGLGRIDQLIESARHSVDLSVYELADASLEHLLILDAARGIDVRVILDGRLERHNNQAAFASLSAGHVKVIWASKSFYASHAKYLVVGHSTLVVMTLNLTSRYYRDTRDFAVVDRDPADVAAAQSVFGDDWAGRSSGSAPVGDHLVWSPGSTARLLRVIDAAHSSIWVENEEMSDRDVISALESAAQRGVTVRVTMTESYSTDRAFDQLVAAGVHVAVYRQDAPLYIHAKVILVDSGTASVQAFIGSQNFSDASLSSNRELGVVLTAQQVPVGLVTVLASDFAGARAWTGSAPG
jgi:cardiolipin synthase A/B